MIKTVRRLLLQMMLLSIFLASSFQSFGAAFTNFSWSSTSSSAGAAVTYTFSYTIQTANPYQIFHARIKPSVAKPFDCSIIGTSGTFNTSLVNVTINGVVQDLNPSWSWGLNEVVVFRLANPANAIAGANVVVTIQDIVNTVTSGSYDWQWIRTGDSGGNEIDGTVNPAPIISSSGPAISTSPSSLAFGHTLSGGTSSVMSYNLAANTLSPASGNIAVTPPANFEVSLSSGSGFSASAINVPYTSGSLTSTPVYVRFKPTATNTYSGNISNTGGGASTQNVAVTGASVLTYCTPSTSSYACGYMWMTNVTTTGGSSNFSNSTACTASSYTDYSATRSVSQMAGGSVTMNFTSYQYGLNYAVWIDLNDDGTFGPTEKLIALGNGSNATSVSAVLTIPSDATVGSHRMRIMGEYYGFAAPDDPCATLTYGETEDYMLIVAIPPAITSFTPSTSASGTTITITGTNFTSATSVKFGGTEASSFTVVNSTSITAVVGSGTTGTISVTAGGTATSSGTFTFIAPPFGSASQAFCAGASLADLTATGTAIKWYAAASGGTALAASVVLVNATHYYTSQTIEGIESGRLDVTAIINARPEAPTTVTANPSSVNLGSYTNLNATSTGNTINWYTVASGGTAIGSSASAADYAVTPVGTTTYYAEAAAPSGSSGSQTFETTESIVNFTVPAGVTTLTMDVRGAQGGDMTGYPNPKVGGRGARVTGDISVSPGQVLKILVGGAGTTSSNFSSGGGGSYVTTGPNSVLITPLMVAGGGGGAAVGLNGSPGQITTSGAASSGGVAGGVNGNGGTGGYTGGGGGGLLTDGGTGINYNTDGGNAFINGGAGATISSGVDKPGGFGGGGSSEGMYAGMGGAGGGYSGGGGGGSVSGTQGSGGGGGSYNGGTNQTNTAGYQTGSGQVIISWAGYTGCTSATRTAVTVTLNTDNTWLGTTNSDWNTASNWSNGIPVAVSDVTIPNVFNDPVVNQDPATFARCNNMTIVAGAVVTIAAGKALTVSGTLTNIAGNTGLVINSGASLIETTTGIAATVKRAIPASKWHLISSPVADATSLLFKDYYLQNHAESTNEYTDILLTNIPLNVMQGYALYGNTSFPTAVYAGTLNAGPKSFSTTYSGVDYGWNLVGNPYPSSIDWNASGWTKTNVNATTYCHITGASGALSDSWATFVAGTPGVGVNGGTRYIASGQGFFVQATAAGKLAMTDAVRVHNASTFYKKSEEVVPNLVRLEVSGNSYKDEAVVRFLPEATTEFDGQYDAHKFYGDAAEAAQIYTTGSTPLSINSLPETDVVPVGVKAGISSTYTIAATEINDLQNVTLEDIKTGIFTKLAEQSYTFGFEAGENEMRFKLHFISILAVDVKESAVAAIYSYHKTACINLKNQLKGDIYIYNIAGQLVATRLSATGMYEIGLAITGNYIVKVVTDKTSQVKKIFIQ